MKKHEVADVVDYIVKLPHGAKVQILVPFRQHANRKPLEELGILMQKGFSRLYAGGSLVRIEELQEQKAPKIAPETFVLVDRIVVKDFEEDDKHRIADSVQTAFYESEGYCTLEVDGKLGPVFSNRFELDGIQFEEPVRTSFPSITPTAPAPPVKDSARCWGSTATS